MPNFVKTIILYSINCPTYCNAPCVHAKHNFGISRKHDGTTGIKIKLRPTWTYCK